MTNTINKLSCLILSIVLLSCGSDSSTEKPDVINQNPTTPVALSPTNNSLCQVLDLEFSWSAATDPDGDDLIYQIDIASDESFANIERSGKTANTSKIFNLNKGVHYFWRVKSIDGEQASSEYSSTWQFITEDDGSINYVPFNAELLLPEDGSTHNQTSMALSWEAEDLDGDSLTFDLYFGTDIDNPELLEENLTQANHSVSDLTGNSTYYWYVVVKDTAGNSSVGKTWSFSLN
jgi:hypothetical protein